MLRETPKDWDALVYYFGLIRTLSSSALKTMGKYDANSICVDKVFADLRGAVENFNTKCHKEFVQVFWKVVELTHEEFKEHSNEELTVYLPHYLPCGRHDVRDVVSYFSISFYKRKKL